MAEEVMSKDLATCSPDDDVKQALALMHARRVRRLPVVDKDRIVKGILSLHDVVMQAGSDDLPYAAVVKVMTGYRELAAPRPALATAQA